MTHEEAIKAISIHKAYMREYEAPKTKYALDMAIAALREQEELERNSHGIATACEYCNGSGKRFIVDDDIPFGSYNSIRLDGNKAFLDDADGFSIRIKFCPMCGRRLEEV